MSSSSRDGLLAVCGSFTTLTTTTVVLRFYVRRKYEQPLKIDDWLAFIGVAAYVAAASCTIVSVHHRYLGVPNAEYTPELEAQIAKSKLSAVLTLCLDILINTTLACSKLSVVFLYRRVFVTGALKKRHWMNVATWATIAVIVLWLFTFQFLTGFSCGTHFAALWDGSYAQFCGLAFPNLYGLAISDFLLDLCVLALPIPKILQIHTSLSKKLSILGVFLLAFIGLGACIARMVLYIRVETGGPSYLFSHSEMRLTTQQFYLNMLEGGMSCFAVNLPSLGTYLANCSVKGSLNSVRNFISLPLLQSRQHNTASAVPENDDLNENKLCDRCSSSEKSIANKSSVAGFARASQVENQKVST